MQTQQTRRLQVLPVQVMTLALGLLVALTLAGLFGYSLKALSVSRPESARYAIGAVGQEQIAHDRSEQGLGPVNSVGGQQIAHNRSEQGLTDR